MEEKAYIQKRYWATMTHTYYSMIYMQKYSSRAEKITKCVNIFLAIVATGSVTLWFNLQNVIALIWLWPSLVAVSEIVHIVWPILNIEKIVPKIQKFVYLLNQYYTTLANDWLYVRNGSLTDEEINAKILAMNTTIDKTEFDIFDGSQIPLSKKLLSSAEQESNRYFEQNF
jgi:hypothetical protein